MATYRCSNCGSPNVTKHESNGGFSYKKALVGTMVFGDIGAVAGINGKKNIEYTCADCFQTSKHPMDDYQRDLIDTSMILYDLFEQLHPDLVKRYSYLKKEIAQKKASQNSNGTKRAVPTASEATIDTGITLTEFMDAAKQWYDLLYFGEISTREIYNSLLKGRKVSHAPLNSYIAALHELPKKITLALPQYANYLYLPNHDDGKGKELGRRSLRQAVLYYALQQYGDNLSLAELYDIYCQDTALNQALNILQYHKFNPDPESCDSDNRLNGIIHFQSQFGFRSELLRSDDPLPVQNSGKEVRKIGGMEIIRGILVIDGALYARARNIERQFEQAMPDIKRTIDELQARIEKKTQEIEESIDSAIESKSQGIASEISEINTEIAQHEKSITKLRRKIFGKQKANAEADNLEVQVNSLTAKIKKLTQEETNYKQTMQDEREKRIKSANKADQNTLNELLKQKKEFIQNTELICLIPSES